MQSNRRVTQASLDRGGSPVTLNLRIFEADQCATVSAMMFSVPSVDGIELDEHFQPKNYFILRIHPGNYVYLPGYVGMPWDYDTFPAAKVCHWFARIARSSPRHPGTDPGPQSLRAVAGLHQQHPEERPHPIVLGDRHRDQRPRRPARGCRGGPHGYLRFRGRHGDDHAARLEGQRLEPDLPGRQVSDFKRELLCEIGRCINMPLCVIAGDSSGYNYASGRSISRSTASRSRSIVANASRPSSTRSSSGGWTRPC